jgi:5'-nucleotidase
MHILICNDDGIYAPGIRVLHEAVEPLGRVSVVAPDSERSAVGHAITVSSPLKAKRVDLPGAFAGQAVTGTPADCVKLAVSCLLDEPPDLVVSGINLGPNAGISVLYSGTVSGATEGAILGIPSIAFSLATYEEPHWDTARQVARYITGSYRTSGLPCETLLNVNIPNLPFDRLEGYAVVRVGKSRYVEEFHARSDPRGNAYYWMDGVLKLCEDTRENDVEMLRRGYVTLTPIKYDLTDHDALATLAEWGGRL